jgi:hypothetical protein
MKEGDKVKITHNPHAPNFGGVGVIIFRRNRTVPLRFQVEFEDGAMSDYDKWELTKIKEY